MPNVSKLSKYVSPQDVRDNDLITIMDEGIIANKEFKEKDGTIKVTPVLELNVSVNGENKVYSPNKTTIKYLSEAWGKETSTWVGKQIRVNIVMSSNGKDMIVGKPV